MGDARTYAATIAIRAVESEDGMTADWAQLPPLLLAHGNRIVGRVKGVNRSLRHHLEAPGTIGGIASAVFPARHHDIA